MSSLSKTLALLGFLITSSFAQTPPLGICNSAACDYCPNSVATAGTGYPACVIYNRDDVLGGKAGDYAPELSGKRELFFDLPQMEGDCKILIRSPATTTDPNCGVPKYGGKGGECWLGKIEKTFMVQFCCGYDDCLVAGAPTKRDVPSVSSFVLRDGDGNIIAPRAVGDGTGDKYMTFLEDHGINASSTIQTRSEGGVLVYKSAHDLATKKRACDEFVPEGAKFTKTGIESMRVGGYLCGDGTKLSVSNEQSVSRTTTFSASVGDPFGIISATVGLEFEESATQSFTYEFTPDEGVCGYVIFTPFFVCVKGKFVGCDGGDQSGEACTAERISGNQISGSYNLVEA